MSNVNGHMQDTIPCDMFCAEVCVFRKKRESTMGYVTSQGQKQLMELSAGSEYIALKVSEHASTPSMPRALQRNLKKHRTRRWYKQKRMNCLLVREQQVGR